jgi:hypothetical protein
MQCREVFLKTVYNDVARYASEIINITILSSPSLAQVRFLSLDRLNSLLLDIDPTLLCLL